jgi:hypothetical protein
MAMHIEACDMRFQKPRTGRGTMICEPIRWVAAAAASMATGEARYPANSLPPS